MLQTPTKKVPRVVRRLVTQFEWSHVKVVSAIRALVALWLLFLGSILCAYGYWWGAVLYLAAAGVGWLAYEMPRWKSAIDAEGGRTSIS
jgi:hypothetical protein